MNFKGHAKDLRKSLSFMTCDTRAYGFEQGYTCEIEVF